MDEYPCGHLLAPGRTTCRWCNAASGPGSRWDPDPVHEAASANLSDEPFWLIERGQSIRHVPTVWWTGERIPNVEQWTTDALKARRFATREDCERQIEALSGFVRLGQDSFGIATEHGVMGPERAGLDARGSARERLLTVLMTCDPESAPSLLRLVQSVEAEAVAAERVRLAEAVRALTGASWGNGADGKRVDWLVERPAVTALIEAKAPEPVS